MLPAATSTNIYNDRRYSKCTYVYNIMCTCGQPTSVFYPQEAFFFAYDQPFSYSHSLSRSLSLSLFHTHTCCCRVASVVVIVRVVYTMIHNIIYSRDTITNAMTTSVLLGVCSIPDISLPVCVMFAKNDQFCIKQEHWGSILYFFLRKPFHLSSIVIILQQDYITIWSYRKRLGISTCIGRKT